MAARTELDEDGRTPEEAVGEQVNPEPVGGEQVDTDDDVLDIPRLMQERDDLEARWRRAQADYQNLKRRQGAELDDMLRRHMQPLLSSLLLVLDHLDMALQTPCESEDAKNLAVGVKMTRDQMLRALEDDEVRPVPEQGAFDPALHQAVATVEDADVAAGEIVDTVRRGYTWRDAGAPARSGARGGGRAHDR